jgi:hypothetical protein
MGFFLRSGRSICFLIFVTIICSCTKNNDYSLGEEFIDSQTALSIIDTFQVGLSTVLLDSIPTSGTGSILVGSYSDSLFGEVDCESYFDVASPTSFTIEDGAIFDSASFELGYSGYYYGDTTYQMSISIHQLKERIVLNDDGYLYNTSNFEFSETTLGKIVFLPEPKSSDSILYIPVNEFGEELFNLISEKASVVSTYDLFADYMKGFVLTSDQNMNHVVLGFNADAKYLRLNIYYHLENIVIQDKTFEITMGESTNQFNYVHHDFAGTNLSSLNAGNNELGISITGNQAYMEAMTGLMPKIQFPTLESIFGANRWKVIMAKLIVKPETNAKDYFTLPNKLYLYITDKHNKLGNLLSDDDGYTVSASLNFDEIYGENTEYTFNITSFINNEIEGGYFNNDTHLFIGTQGTKINSSLIRMVIGGNDQSVKLRLYYLSY